MWFQHLTWFWLPLQMDNEQRAWMGAKGVDPLRQGANARKAQTTGPEESLCRPAPRIQNPGLAFAPPNSKELGIAEFPRGSQSGSIEPGVLDMGATWTSGWKVPLRLGHPAERQLILCVSCSQSIW